MSWKSSRRAGRIPRRKSSLVSVPCSLILLLVSHHANAQTKDLDRMSRDMLSRSRLERLDAISRLRGGTMPIKGVAADGSYFSLQRMLYGMPEYFISMNDSAAVTTRTDTVQSLIGGGTGFLIGIWDVGTVRTTHQELTGRVTWADTATLELSDHSTHVGGTMIASGVEPWAEGMAYAASLNSYDWDEDLGEMADEAASDLLISNHSYGKIRGWYVNFYTYWLGDTTVSEDEDYLFGFYDDRTADIDELANAAPDYLIVWAAGNERDDAPVAPGASHLIWDKGIEEWIWSSHAREEPDGGVDGYDCIANGGGLSKNTLTVGAVKDVFYYTGPADVVMPDFSSWGPTDDGRIKPDIVGNGVSVTSCLDTSDDAYGTGSGTSMASPNVAGSLALLQDYYMDHHGDTPMHAATLKALAIHTAREAGPDPGPDYMFGWGLLDTYAAYWRIVVDLDDKKGQIEELTLNDGETIELIYRCNGSPDEMRFTICWNDPAGTPPLPALNPPDIMLVNDLDIRVTHGATEHQPWRLDPAAPGLAAARGDNFRDNVEQIVIDDPAAGDYHVTISHKSALQGGSQDVSLIASGGIRRRNWHIYADGSGDTPDITTAAFEAGPDDSIFVHPGVFYEHDITINKKITIVGTDGAESTIIDAQSLGRCIYMPLSPDTVVVEGLTLRNGLIVGAAPYGGGIYCRNSLALIQDCIITGNEAEDGGGIYLYEASPRIGGCTIDGNTATYRGGGIWGLTTVASVDSCVITDNSAAYSGGGIYIMGSSVPVLDRCTLSGNSAVEYGSGIYLGNASAIDIYRSIIAFGTLAPGIEGHPYTAGAVLTCCDVYGNVEGDYGSYITDQTGISDNISEEPLFCDVSADDYHLYDISPCAQANSPCGQLIGRHLANCVAAPDLVITDVDYLDYHPEVGDVTEAMVTIRNNGMLAAYGFYTGFYSDLSSPPMPPASGEIFRYSDSLPAGETMIWHLQNIENTTFEQWTTYFLVDYTDIVPELDEGNNTSGPHSIWWEIPVTEGWPVAGGGDFNSSPAIALLDDDPRTKEVVIGSDDGYLYALMSDGEPAPGWPVDLGSPITSSPAVGDIVGDFHNEVVVGCGAYLYALDRHGKELWNYGPGRPVSCTPALADLDDDGKLEILFSRTTLADVVQLIALEGDGSLYSGSWPVAPGGTDATSAAVGDMDGDGSLEIAFVVSGFTKPVGSRVYLLNEAGGNFSGSWPVSIDTVVTASPVLGDIAGDGDLEIITGGQNGKVYAINLAGSVWPYPPQVQGMIERSLALAQLDKDGYHEIVAGSRYWYEAIPPIGSWYGKVTVLDNDGTIVSGWPNSTGSWFSPVVTPSPVALYGRIMAGTPGGYIYGWRGDDFGIDGFPRDVAGGIYSSLAFGDLDGDGYLEMVAATSYDSVYCFELSSDPDFAADSPVCWPMYRNERTRCGCYYPAVVTDVAEPEEIVPSFTALHSIYPNPFNPVTRITFDIAVRSRVRIAVYDAAGRIVSVLKDGIMETGRHHVVWDGRTENNAAAASGIYFCRLIAGDVSESCKMVLIR